MSIFFMLISKLRIFGWMGGGVLMTLSLLSQRRSKSTFFLFHFTQVLLMTAGFGNTR